MDQSTPSPRYKSRPRMDFSHTWKFNDYRVDGSSAYLTLRNRQGEPCGEAIIDLWDLDRVINCTHWGRSEVKPGIFYVRGMMRGMDAPKGSRKPAIFLHRFIVDAQPGQEIDHWNGNALDCRRENLRITDRKGNALNLHGHRRVREMEHIVRELLRCPHHGEQCACKKAALLALERAA